MTILVRMQALTATGHTMVLCHTLTVTGCICNEVTITQHVLKFRWTLREAYKGSIEVRIILTCKISHQSNVSLFVTNPFYCELILLSSMITLFRHYAPLHDIPAPVGATSDITEWQTPPTIITLHVHRFQQRRPPPRHAKKERESGLRLSLRQGEQRLLALWQVGDVARARQLEGDVLCCLQLPQLHQAFTGLSESFRQQFSSQGIALRRNDGSFLLLLCLRGNNGTHSSYSVSLPCRLAEGKQRHPLIVQRQFTLPSG